MIEDIIGPNYTLYSAVKYGSVPLIRTDSTAFDALYPEDVEDANLHFMPFHLDAEFVHLGDARIALKNMCLLVTNPSASSAELSNKRLAGIRDDDDVAYVEVHAQFQTARFSFITPVPSGQTAGHQKDDWLWFGRGLAVYLPNLSVAIPVVSTATAWANSVRALES